VDHAFDVDLAQHMMVMEREEREGHGHWPASQPLSAVDTLPFSTNHKFIANLTQSALFSSFPFHQSRNNGESMNNPLKQPLHTLSSQAQMPECIQYFTNSHSSMDTNTSDDNDRCCDEEAEEVGFVSMWAWPSNIPPPPTIPPLE
jgi:hypothetical protein